MSVEHGIRIHVEFYWSVNWKDTDYVCIQVLFEFLLNVFIEFSDKNDIRSFKKKGTAVLKPVISCVRKQHSTSAPQGHWQQRRSLIDTNSCFSDLPDSLNLLNSLKYPFYLGKTPLDSVFTRWVFICLHICPSKCHLEYNNRVQEVSLGTHLYTRTVFIVTKFANRSPIFVVLNIQIPKHFITFFSLDNRHRYLFN